MISFKQSGNFNNTERLLSRAKRLNIAAMLDNYGKAGVEVLKNATPVDTGETANSWIYEIEVGRRQTSISWRNTNVKDGIPVVILLEYGHATQNGSFVQGVEFVEPAIRPIFDEIAESAWKEVTR